MAVTCIEVYYYLKNIVSFLDDQKWLIGHSKRASRIMAN